VGRSWTDRRVVAHALQTANHAKLASQARHKMDAKNMLFAGANCGRERISGQNFCAVFEDENEDEDDFKSTLRSSVLRKFV
jgi:predicted alpha/beta hydrolase family esterase